LCLNHFIHRAHNPKVTGSSPVPATKYKVFKSNGLVYSKPFFMQNILDLLTLEVQKELDLEHDSEHQTPFSEPKIYDADGDLSKRWYVYFSFVDPKTCRLKRMKNIYGKTNRYKTKESRYYLLGLYRKRLLKLLQEGYNPFQDNTDHHIKRRHKDKETALIRDRPIALESKKETVSVEKKEIQQDDERQLSVREAIDYALELKVNVAGASTLVDYKSRCDLFVKWIAETLKKHIK
jgi:hypothetical protein